MRPNLKLQTHAARCLDHEGNPPAAAARSNLKAASLFCVDVPVSFFYPRRSGLSSIDLAAAKQKDAADAAASKGAAAAMRGPIGLLVGHLRDDLILGEGYPWELMFFHCVKSMVSWRAFCEVHEGTEQAGRGTVYNLVAAFFCVGFGGTHLRDWTMGQSPNIFKNQELTKAVLLAFGLVYYIPFDAFFKLASSPDTFTWKTAHRTIIGVGPVLY
jgi:hypothetical protein